MSNTPLNLTRNQLAEFLPNQRAIRAFEQILKSINTSISDDYTALNRLIQEASLTADDGVARSQLANDLISAITTAVLLNSLEASPQHNLSLETDFIDLSKTAPAPILQEGRVWWSPTGTMNIGMGGGNITQQVGEEIFVYGKASAAITEGQLVMVTGAVGASGVLKFAPTSIGLTDPNAILGVATENIANNDFGRITIIGIVHGIDTTGSSVGEVWADGDVLWYNPAVVGSMTNVKPAAPNMKTQVAIVINAGAGGSGSLQVEVLHGSKLGETDSNVQFVGLANRNIIQYDSALGYWKNVSAPELDGLTVLGNTTLGDAGSDSVTANAATWSFNNATTFTFNLSSTLKAAAGRQLSLGSNGAGNTLTLSASETVCLGGVAPANTNLYLAKGMGGAASSFGIYNAGAVQPSATGAGYYNQAVGSTAANGGTPYTVGAIFGYSATQGTFHADSTVTSQYGFIASSALVGATNNYGFYSQVPAAAGRWNFVAQGTANNAYAGASRFGALTAPVNTVDITGSLGRGAPVTKTADFTLAATENWIINNKAGATLTVTLPAASSWTGREFTIKTIQAQTVVSASSNIIPLAGGAAGTAILAATAGKWATLVSNGTNWEIMAAN